MPPTQYASTDSVRNNAHILTTGKQETRKRPGFCFRRRGEGGCRYQRYIGCGEFCVSSHILTMWSASATHTTKEKASETSKVAGQKMNQVRQCSISYCIHNLTHPYSQAESGVRETKEKAEKELRK